MAICEQRPLSSVTTKEEERLYLLEIGFRGQTVMTQLGVMDDFMDNSVPVYGRRDWAPDKGHTDGTISYSNKTVTSRILSREQLIHTISHHFITDYPMDNVDIYYCHQISITEFDTEDTPNVQVQITKCTSTDNTTTTNEEEVECNVKDDTRLVRTSLLIGADESARTIANAMEEQDKLRKQNIRNPWKRWRYQPFQVTQYDKNHHLQTLSWTRCQFGHGRCHSPFQLHPRN